MIDAQTKIEFLKSMGCDKELHSGTTLLEHLIGTRDIVKERGGSEYLQDACLFHSVYGTQRFSHQSTSDREKVKSLIGEKAEELVYIFSMCPYPRTDKIKTMYRGQIQEDLLAMDGANEDEQLITSEVRLNTKLGKLFQQHLN